VRVRSNFYVVQTGEFIVLLRQVGRRPVHRYNRNE